MPVPTYSKSGVATFTFEKARFLPVRKPKTPGQIIGKAGGNQVKVANVAPVEQLFMVVVDRVTSTQEANLRTFIEDSNINYSLNTFTFTDENSTTYTVRFWNLKNFDIPQVKGSLFNMNHILRVEIL